MTEDMQDNTEVIIQKAYYYANLYSWPFFNLNVALLMSYVIFEKIVKSQHPRQCTQTRSLYLWTINWTFTSLTQRDVICP